mgnify:CR=1 FL=1
MHRMSSFGCGRCLSRSRRRIAPWAAREKKVAANYTKSAWKPYHIYFEGNAGLLARDYAKFPNKVLWKLAEKVREVVSAGKMVRIEDALGTNLTATYDGKRLYGMQFRAGDPPGRCHFPGAGAVCSTATARRNGEVYLSCVQGVAGMLAEPMRWKVKDSLITAGGRRRRNRRRVQTFVQRGSRVESSDRNHVRLPPESVGAAWHRSDPMHWELISKMPWAG